MLLRTVRWTNQVVMAYRVLIISRQFFSSPISLVYRNLEWSRNFRWFINEWVWRNRLLAQTADYSLTLFTCYRYLARGWKQTRTQIYTYKTFLSVFWGLNECVFKSWSIYWVSNQSRQAYYFIFLMKLNK